MSIEHPEADRDRHHRRRPGRPGHRATTSSGAAARASSSTPTSGSGDNWRANWDTLRLYSPAGSDGLPGLPFPGPRWSYPTKDEVADYLAAYVDRFALPVRTGVRVDRLEAADGGYALRLGTETVLRRERRRGHGHLRPYAEHPRVRAGPRPRRSASCTPASTAGRTSCAPVGCWSSAPRTPAPTSRTSWRPPTRRCWPAGTPGSCRSGWTTGARGCSGRRSCSSARHLITRRTPDRPQGDGRRSGSTAAR